MKKRFIVCAVIGVCALIAGVVAIAVVLTRRNGNSSSADGKDEGLIVIIGAGITGATIASELKRYGRQFMIVEGKDQVGGRLINTKFGNNINVELGANWIHNYVDDGEFEKLATSLNLDGVPTDFTDAGRYADGEILDSTASAASFTDAWRTAVTEGQRSEDTSILNALAEYAGWKPQDGVDCSSLQFFVDFVFGLSPQKIAVYQTGPDSADLSNFDPWDEFFVKDERGFKTIVDNLLKTAGINDTTKSNDVLLLNSNVTRVEYNSSGARVYLGNGTAIDTRYVISTVSLGVLKSGNIQFDPELSQKKRNALQKAEMGSYTKIFIKFNKPVVTESDPVILSPANCGRASNVQNLNRKPFFPGSNAVLVTILSGNGVNDVDALDAALESVNQVVKEKVDKSMVSEFVFKNFDQDPHFVGAFSNRLVGFNDGDFNALASNEGSLYFAGEMVGDADSYGSVKSALKSGKEVAKNFDRTGL